jgi:hypothetical protein
MEELLSGSQKVSWKTECDEAKYALIAAVLKTQQYSKLRKREKGIVRRFLQKVTASSRAQLTRLIGQWKEHRKIVRGTACAGINRHAVGNERVLQERNSEPPDLESCGGGREAVVEA